MTKIAHQITLEDVQQLADAEGADVATVISLLQGAAAKIGDSATLEQLCEIKSALLGLND